MPPSTTSPVFDTVFFDNEDYYEGDTIDRVPHGFGTMYYADGEEREGYWFCGLPVTGAKPDEKIPGYSKDHYQNLVTINGGIFSVGQGYMNDSIAEYFGVSKFIRGIRIHRNRAVLFSVDNSVYKDGIGWEKDADGEYIFKYTGEGLDGDQEMSNGNFFLKNSHGGLFLFVRRRANDYIFHGEVEVKRIEQDIEPDRKHNQRKVFKFILRRRRIE